MSKGLVPCTLQWSAGEQHQCCRYQLTEQTDQEGRLCVWLNLDTLEAVVERRTLNKLLSILGSSHHPLHPLMDRQRSRFSDRLLQLRCHKDRHRKLFLPTATTLFNTSPLASRELSALCFVAVLFLQLSVFLLPLDSLHYLQMLHCCLQDFESLIYRLVLL